VRLLVVADGPRRGVVADAKAGERAVHVLYVGIVMAMAIETAVAAQVGRARRSGPRGNALGGALYNAITLRRRAANYTGGREALEGGTISIPNDFATG
jgi:hypothetical protein